MKRIFILFYISISISQIACAQDNYNDLVGSWVLKESKGELIYECPDEIVLKKDKTYEILNECYGTDMRKPTIEKGSWHFNLEKECIIFTNRVILSSYVFQNKNLELTLYIHDFENTEVVVSYSKEKTSVNEKYFKRYTLGEVVRISGTGNAINEILLTGAEKVLKIEYNFLKVSDRLIIEDQMGNIVFKTEMTSESSISAKEIELARSVRKLIFKIESEKSDSKWNYHFELK